MQAIKIKVVNGRCVATGFSSMKGHGIQVTFKNELKEKMSLYEGVYVQSTAMLNERPSYVQQGGENGIWFNKRRNVWTIGKMKRNMNIWTENKSFLKHLLFDWFLS